MQTRFPEVLDSSMLASFKQCPQLFYKTYIEQWKPKGQSVHLHAGAAFAKGLESARQAFFVEGTDSETAVAIGLKSLFEAYGDFECPPESAKSLERMGGALEYYFSIWPLNHEDCIPVTVPGGKRGIEFSFAHPLPINHPETGNPLLYVGRMDQLMTYAGGTYIEDDKTTSQLGASWSRQWDLRSQFTGYAWGCRGSGIRVDGVVIRGVSILKTKYDHAEAISYRTEWNVEQWLDELIGPRGWIEDMLRCLESNKWRHNFDHACADFGGCTFRIPCSSQDEQPWLDQYFERRFWDPVTRTETRLGNRPVVPPSTNTPQVAAIDLDTPL